MGHYVEIRAADGHQLSAWRSDPDGSARGGVVVIQEIFGVNAHIRETCDRFAAAGYVAIAPALFDRLHRGFESGYSPEEVDEARKFMGAFDWAGGLADIEAAREAVSNIGKVAIVGYCLGGSLAWAASEMPGYAAAVCYYGGQVLKRRDLQPRCPVQMHFGRTDGGIPVSEVEAFSADRPDVSVFLYEAGHGFNCDHRSAYDAASAHVARERTLSFLSSAMVA